MTTTELLDLLIITQPTHGDDRGFFRQTYVSHELDEALDRPVRFVQGNHARSSPGVLRGIHAEPWDKLVYVARGRVQAVFVDLRPESETFGHHVSLMLGDGTQRARVFVPEGIGNSYCVVGDEAADYLYDVTAVWSPDVEKRDVAWNDPDLDVRWELSEPILSVDDARAPRLRDRFPDHPLFNGGTR